jgi:hypothetical protein
VMVSASAHRGEEFYEIALGVSILGMTGGALALLQVAAGSRLVRRRRALGAADYARLLVAGLAMVLHIPLIVWLCVTGTL